MSKGLLIFAIAALLFSGCATTHKGKGTQDIEELSTRVESLEQKVNDNSEELQIVKEKVDYGTDVNFKSGSSSYSDNYSKKVSSTGYSKSKYPAKSVQSALKAAGFYDGPVDGKLGPKTKEAIKAFQQANGLTADGVIGKRTWAKLKEY
ncbi:secreted protein containing Peptidoglycan binding-like domain protein [Candidatus Omnitrophus magneticus]|uniref:Secreted protein containing Peptidoglycan binding-like domain protein n=1 Tax=Candidatus Omnitrophus magneticus TaxID=1609969 RepID=A0A0F0CPK3_9BACT|nr:secreted protein containing Peptidoglycan binding-like domain protein [Candidatus Omnitrophus magneticus]